MQKEIISLVLLLMVGSPVFGSGEPTSLYLEAARKAEKSGNYRMSIYCLCKVLLEQSEKLDGSKLGDDALLNELANEFKKAHLPVKSQKLKILSGRALGDFLALEAYSADPTQVIDVYSDGTLRITQKPENGPIPVRKAFAHSALPATIVRKSDPSYERNLAQFWWFQMPGPQVLATKPVFTPDIPQISVPDGAFADYKESK